MILYNGLSQSLGAEFKDCMMRRFEMIDLVLLHYFFGLEVYKSRVEILISQRIFAWLIAKLQLCL